MSPTTYLVTGASRGIGLGLVKHLLAEDGDAHILAAAREPEAAAELQLLVEAHGERLVTLKLDLVSQLRSSLATGQAC